MPFTPLHFGVGALCHAVAPRRVSLSAFCAGTVLIDLEPLYYLLRGEFPLHRFWHSYVGATLLLLLAQLAFRWLRRRDWFGFPQLTRANVFAGLSLGLYSHVLLDSVMHADMHPWWPVLGHNALLNWVSIDALYNGCLLAGVLGFIWLVLRGEIEI